MRRRGKNAIVARCVGQGIPHNFANFDGADLVDQQHLSGLTQYTPLFRCAVRLLEKRKVGDVAALLVFIWELGELEEPRHEQHAPTRDNAV